MLYKTVDNKREHQDKQRPNRRPKPPHTDERRNHPEEHPRAPGADRELDPPAVKGAIRPSVAAENDRQPFVQKIGAPVKKLLQYLLIIGIAGDLGSGADTDYCHKDIDNDDNADADKSADTGLLGGKGLSVLPHEK